MEELKQIGFAAWAPLAIIAILIVVLIVGAIINRRKAVQRPESARYPEGETAAQFLREPKEGGNGTVTFILFLWFATWLDAAYTYWTATTVFQQIVGLLIWIGGNSGFGLLLVIATIARK